MKSLGRHRNSVDSQAFDNQRWWIIRAIAVSHFVVEFRGIKQNRFVRLYIVEIRTSPWQWQRRRTIAHPRLCRQISSDTNEKKQRQSDACLNAKMARIVVGHFVKFLSFYQWETIECSNASNGVEGVICEAEFKKNRNAKHQCESMPSDNLIVLQSRLPKVLFSSNHIPAQNEEKLRRNFWEITTFVKFISSPPFS